MLPALLAAPGSAHFGADARQRAVTARVETTASAEPTVFDRRAGIVLESLLLAAVALFFLNFKPLGALNAGNRYSQDLVYAWFGQSNWLYPRMAAPISAAKSSRPRVVVVLVDERALALRGAHWPVPLDFHAQLLSELAVLKPRAVMLDFLLIDPASTASACAFVRVAAALRDGGTRPYMAVTRPDELDALDVGECRDDAGRPLAANHVLTPVAVRLQVDPGDFVNRRYPFAEHSADVTPGTVLASAAVHMYCDGSADAADCLRRLTGVGPQDAGYELAWSPLGDPFNQRWSQARCNRLPSPTRAILFKEGLPRESPCPPIATLFAAALLSPTEDASLGVGNEELFDLVGGAYVFVGGNFRGTGDLMTTPLHTRLPGVYYHAVALDNLLAFEGQPKIRKQFRDQRLGYYAFDLLVLWALALIYLGRERWVSLRPAGSGPFALSSSARAWLADGIGRVPTALWVVATAFALLLLSAFPQLQLAGVVVALALLITIEMRTATVRDLSERIRGLLYYLAAVGASLVVVALAIAVGYRWLALPPVDWIGYLSFAAFGFFVAHTAILEFARRVDSIHGLRTRKKVAK